MKNAVSKVLIFVGIVAIVLAIVCYVADPGSYEPQERYGGDAYTGIQNAAATTATNVRDIGRIMRLGFGSVLLISGLAMAGIGAAKLSESGKEPEFASMNSNPIVKIDDAGNITDTACSDYSANYGNECVTDEGGSES